MTDTKTSVNTSLVRFNIKDKDEVIADYIAGGYTLIKLFGKVPAEKQWTSTPFNMFLTAKDLPANYGVKLNADMLVIDYDPRNDDTPNRQAVQNLSAYLDNFVFDCFTVKTGGGGFHFYLTKPPDLAIVNALPKADYPQFAGLEFKTAGRQVVGALSVHPETQKLYTIAYRRPSHRLDAPPKLLELIKRHGAVQGIDLSHTVVKFTDDEQSEQRYITFLNSHPPAVEGGGGDTHTFKTACRGRDFNLSPEKTYELMATRWNGRCLPPWDEETLWLKVQNAYTYNSDASGIKHPHYDFSPVSLKTDDTADVKPIIFDRSATGQIKKTLHNTICFMQMAGNPLLDRLSYNLFANNIELQHVSEPIKTGWSDNDAILFKCWLSSEKMFEIPTGVIHEAALKVAMSNSFHPIIAYLEQLKWDGVPRIDKWLHVYAGADDNAYVSAVGAKTLLAGVARIYQPGIKFDHVLILEGEQGVGKSTLVDILGKNWYGDIILDPHSRDTVAALKGKWIVELAEMECVRRDAMALKRFISCTSDTARLAYARTSMDFPRQSIFIGTINPVAGKGYLQDSTGNRRFWAVTISKVLIDKLKADVDQLWAEATAVYKKGDVKLWLDDAQIQKQATELIAGRYEVDPWEEIIAAYTATREQSAEHPGIWVTTQEILDECLLIPHGSVNKGHRSRVSSIMSRLGWAYRSKWNGKHVVSCYMRD